MDAIWKTNGISRFTRDDKSKESFKNMNPSTPFRKRFTDFASSKYLVLALILSILVVFASSKIFSKSESSDIQKILEAIKNNASEKVNFTELFPANDEGVYFLAKSLRNLMNSKDGKICMRAVRVYADLSDFRMKEGEKEVYLGARSIRNLMESHKLDAEEDIYVTFLIYSHLSNKFKKGDAEIINEVSSFRKLINNSNADLDELYIPLYMSIFKFLKEGDPEIYKGVELFIQLLKNPKTTSKIIGNFANVFDPVKEGDVLIYKGLEALRSIESLGFGLETMIQTYSAITGKLRVGDERVYQEAKALRDLMGNKKNGSRNDFHIAAYGKLTEKMKQGSAEVYKEAAILRGLMSEGDKIDISAYEDAYAALSSKFEIGHEEVYLGANLLRALMKSKNIEFRRHAIGAYSALSRYFKKGEQEILNGAILLRSMMEEEEENSNVYPHVSSASIRAYSRLSEQFTEGDPEIYEGLKVLRAAMKQRDISVKEDATTIYSHLVSGLKNEDPELNAGGTALRELILGLDKTEYNAVAEAKGIAIFAYSKLLLRLKKNSPEYLKGKELLGTLLKEQDFHLCGFIGSLVKVYNLNIENYYLHNWRHREACSLREITEITQQYNYRYLGL